MGNKIDAPGAKEAAQRLAEEVRKDSLDRVGGNEFEESPLILSCIAPVLLPARV